MKKKNITYIKINNLDLKKCSRFVVRGERRNDVKTPSANNDNLNPRKSEGKKKENKSSFRKNFHTALSSFALISAVWRLMRFYGALFFFLPSTFSHSKVLNAKKKMKSVFLYPARIVRTLINLPALSKKSFLRPSESLRARRSRKNSLKFPGPPRFVDPTGSCAPLCLRSKYFRKLHRADVPCSHFSIHITHNL